MNTLLVYAHPNPRSFNAALAQVIEQQITQQGKQIKVKDLYAMKWNPVLSQEDFAGYHSGNLPQDIKQEQADVAWADLIIMLAPVWWYSVPAILKGYIDRVFSLGFAYKYTATGPLGLLKGKRGLFITTSGANRQDAELGGMMKTLNASLGGVFGFSGFEEKKHLNLYAVTTVSDDERKLMLTEVRDLVTSFSSR
ncbi:MAG: NAD(P)H-dependent oxidoreductase [Syntrophomonas sp.]|jgi:NAD(P)H dehydrogenase (quinone)|nr:NAD(P)H-dependent oxidoreductase [Syntrophomonas sp.]